MLGAKANAAYSIFQQAQPIWTSNTQHIQEARYYKIVSFKDAQLAVDSSTHLVLDSTFQEYNSVNTHLVLDGSTQLGLDSILQGHGYATGWQYTCGAGQHPPGACTWQWTAVQVGTSTASSR